jgi:DNA repair protein RAD57
VEFPQATSQKSRAKGNTSPTPGFSPETDIQSGAGKTQFLLTLLLAAQLPSPYGLSSSVLYISTESALPTTRLSQLLRTHPILSTAIPKPTLDSVISIVTPDLESQDHIIRYQVPVAIRRHGIRLIILDSVAANYRAEFERPGGGIGQTNGANMAQRSSELVKLGQLLRDIAREENIAVVVANQVADRFSRDGRGSPVLNRVTHSSPLARRSGGVLPESSMAATVSSASVAAELGLGNIASTPFVGGTTDPMSLDHQQRWFTGWGDDQHPSFLTVKNLKSPSLGLIWTTQIACRIALIKKPVYGPGLVADEENETGEPVLRKWRRWMKVVFAPHVGPSVPGLKGAVEFEIKGEGVRSVKGKGKSAEDADE